MAKRARHFFEPWRAEKSKAWETAFQFGPPADPEAADRWHADHARCEKAAEWLLWGEGVWEPSVCTGLGGAVTVMDGSGIVVKVTAIKSDAPDTPDAEAISTRVAECVNACEGLIAPADAIREARDVLLGLVNGCVEPTDPRVLRAMIRLHPPDHYQRGRRDPMRDDSR